RIGSTAVVPDGGALALLASSGGSGATAVLISGRLTGTEPPTIRDDESTTEMRVLSLGTAGYGRRDFNSPLIAHATWRGTGADRSPIAGEPGSEVSEWFVHEWAMDRGPVLDRVTGPVTEENGFSMAVEPGLIFVRHTPEGLQRAAQSLDAQLAAR